MSETSEASTEVPADTPSKLVHSQRIQMLDEIRKLRGEGKPEKAAEIVVALNNDTFSLGSGDVNMVGPHSEPKRGDPVEAWRVFALDVSDIDYELINETRKGDLIKMLEATGIIERLSRIEILHNAELAKIRSQKSKEKRKQTMARNKAKAKKK